MNPPSVSGPILVCFAVREEAAFFRPAPGNSFHTEVLLTGMGKKNAEKTFEEKIKTIRPSLVLSSGFAGGLNPALSVGDVVFEEDCAAHLSAALPALGAIPARFYCANRVAVTAEEKQKLRQETGCDAVEMESSVIRQICRDRQIPNATLRVISDAAGDDLILDFNALMTREWKIDYFKLARVILRNPAKVPGLISFQRQTAQAARKLGSVLDNLLRLRGN